MLQVIQDFVRDLSKHIEDADRSVVACVDIKVCVSYCAVVQVPVVLESAMWYLLLFTYTTELSML